MNRSIVLRFAAAALLLLTSLPETAPAQEPFATHPPLPPHYASIKVFDRQSRFVGRILPEHRYWTPIERIPAFLQKAVVAVEDARFYEHGGIDVRGIARAALKNVVRGRLAEGGSTITQQLIKNKYLGSEKTFDRKLNEGLLATEFEKKYTKKQILEMYFNEIYFGNGAWGIAQASRLYFDKNPEELSEAESSILAGIPKNPGRFNPLAKPEDVGRRRDVVLKRMLETGALDTRKQTHIRRQSAAPVQRSRAPYYLAHVRSSLIERYGAGIIEQGGLEVTTAMDLNLQMAAEQAIQEGVGKLSPQLQGALVAVDPANGNLLATVGGVDFVKGPYNRAMLARRQPGSAIKPILYAAAIEHGATASSLWNDSAVSYPLANGEQWRPQNYDGRPHGELTLRQALASSNNVIAVKLLDSLGIPAFAEIAAKMGITLRSNNLSIALGSDEVTLQELTLAYTTLANNGVRPEPRSIIRIYDSRYRTWLENPVSTSQAISSESAFITTQMLKDVLISGTAKGLRKFSLTWTSAGKTGTTNDYRDAWFIGYTPNLVAGVWVGHDQPRPGGRGFTGGAIAAPIWERFMRQALSKQPDADFPRPEGITTFIVDPTSDSAAKAGCPKKHEEFFVAGTEPGNSCPKHGGEPVRQPEPPPLGDRPPVITGTDGGSL